MTLPLLAVACDGTAGPAGSRGSHTPDAAPRASLEKVTKFALTSIAKAISELKRKTKDAKNVSGISETATHTWPLDSEDGPSCAEKGQSVVATVTVQAQDSSDGPLDPRITDVVFTVTGTNSNEPVSLHATGAAEVGTQFYTLINALEGHILEICGDASSIRMPLLAAGFAVAAIPVFVGVVAQLMAAQPAPPVVRHGDVATAVASALYALVSRALSG